MKTVRGLRAGSLKQDQIMKNLAIGKTAIITSDNDSYDEYRGQKLIVTDFSNKGRGYDSSCYPEMLCSFELEDGSEFPFSLYEYEFKLTGK